MTATLSCARAIWCWVVVSLANIKRFVDWTHSWVSYLLRGDARADENHIYAIKRCRVHHFSLSEVARQNCYYCQSRHLLDETLGWFFTHVFGTHCVQPQLENFSKKEAGQNVFITYTQCLKIIEKVSFIIASEASYVYILNGQKFIKMSKMVYFDSFLKICNLR